MKKAFDITLRLLLVAIAISVAATSVYSQEMNKEEWQKQITDLTTKRNDLKNKLTAAQSEVAALQKQDADKATALKLCQDELAQTMKANSAADESAFASSVDNPDAKLNDLSKLSNQDLYARRAELDSVQAWIDNAKKSPFSAVEKYANRLKDVQGRLDALRKSLEQSIASGQAMQTYTVGTWAKDRDCLWNIAKKPKIYDNAFLWPKIWQGNRDQIKNADVIHPGQKLKIPPKAELTKQEKSALRSYWDKKQVAAAPTK
ncbi:MAG: LysM peptidoglycan-binding domain-containing protein [Ignavibacteriales bacterium]|nr:LysM peptidoglycan-binding domain-containing protein [Ignavibacteriales bacterium]